MAEVGGGQEVSMLEQETAGTPERLGVPNQVIINSPDGSRAIGVNPVPRDILTKEGLKVGRVLEVELMVNPRDTQASLDFRFRKNPDGNYQVLTNGAQSWSSSVAVGKMNDKLVGMRPYEQSLGGKTVPFYDPGLGGEKISKTEGRSSGWVGFRDLDPNNAETRENLVLGEIPSFDGVGGLRYRQEGDSIVVTVTKNLEGVTTERPITFKVFLGQGKPERQEAESGKSNITNQYADLMTSYSKELSKLVTIPLMKDRAIGFSWPVYGKKVTQADVQKEVAAGAGVYDTYTIDDGWETGSGSLTVDQRKFPDLAGLAKQMKDLGIKPGIWISPFKITGKEARKLPYDWFMKDEHGKPRRIPLPGVAGIFERSFMLDVSRPEVRSYLTNKMTDLAKAGFEVFKADFLMVPFTGPLQNKEKTSVQYYREFFEGFRRSVREQLNKEIEIIGCGAPMMESIGLFNGMRITPDTALPVESFVPGLSKIKPLSRLVGRMINTGMYKDAVAVAARRAVPFRGAYGLILDGLHQVDESVSVDPDQRDRKNLSMLALNGLGIGNLFVGDSMVRVGEQGRGVWRNFITKFKETALLSKFS